MYPFEERRAPIQQRRSSRAVRTSATGLRNAQMTHLVLCSRTPKTRNTQHTSKSQGRGRTHQRRAHKCGSTTHKCSAQHRSLAEPFHGVGWLLYDVCDDDVLELPEAASGEERLHGCTRAMAYTPIIFFILRLSHLSGLSSLLCTEPPEHVP